MAGLLESLVKAGVMTELPTNISSEQIRQQFNTSTTRYPQGNDDPKNKDTDAEVQIAGDFKDQNAEEVFMDASLLDQKVRELITASGANFNFKRAMENGTLIKVDDELLAALERLQKAAPLLNKAVGISVRRQYGEETIERLFKSRNTTGGASGAASGAALRSAAGSASGSRSGSQSGSASGDEQAKKYRAIGQALREIVLRHRREGSASGSRSGSSSGSSSGAASEDVKKFMAGDQEAGLGVMGRR